MGHALATSLVFVIEQGLEEHKLAFAFKQLQHLLAYCNLDRVDFYVEQMRLIIQQMRAKNWEVCSGLIQQTARRAITEYSKENAI